VVAPMTASFATRRAMILVRPPLYGVYDVVRFEQNGVELPPLVSDTTRWRRATFTDRRSLSVRLMTDSSRVLPFTVDTVAHRVTLRSSDPRRAGLLSYRRIGADSLELVGHVGADSVAVLLRQLEPRQAFRLAR
jgi:hypothetical protein